MLATNKLHIIVAAIVLIVGAVAYQVIRPRQQFSSPLLIEATVPSPSTTTDPITQESLYLLINAYRLDAKLSPLQPSARLEQSATYKLHDMIEKKYYRHSDNTDAPTWQFFTQAGYQYTLAGENLSFAINTPWQVMEAWMQSPSHNEQLLKPAYKDMGIAIDCQTFSTYPDGGCIVVLHLGKE